MKKSIYKCTLIKIIEVLVNLKAHTAGYTLDKLKANVTLELDSIQAVHIVSPHQ